jgi:hypothetical protein
MRVRLELDPNQSSLTGTASWQGCGAPVAFHGTLELLALLETALETAPGTTTGKARP